MDEIEIEASKNNSIAAQRYFFKKANKLAELFSDAHEIWNIDSHGLVGESRKSNEPDT